MKVEGKSQAMYVLGDQSPTIYVRTYTQKWKTANSSSPSNRIIKYTSLTMYSAEDNFSIKRFTFDTDKANWDGQVLRAILLG